MIETYRTDNKMIDTKQKNERLILVGLEGEDSLDELSLLLESAGAEEAGRLVQSREGAHPGTYVGKGKLEELKLLLRSLEADGIVCDDELTASQLGNLNRELSCKVLDRTLLILDIFAARAVSMEGKLQVELAQQKYRATHLTGLGKELSRQGGGIGTRGPGEKKLEMDRRRIRERITRLKKELADVGRHREVLRTGRGKGHAVTAALVGYTSAGKSTLLNCLTRASVPEDSMLFSTLDLTTRQLTLSAGRQIFLTDTVGFIRKLPHDLIEAFKGTLEEIGYADMIIHVVDASDPLMDEKMQTVYDTLRSLHIQGKPVVTVFNKMDRVTGGTQLRDIRADAAVRISARTGEGTQELLAAIDGILRRQHVYMERLLPYDRSALAARIRQEGEVISEEYGEGGIALKAYVPRRILGELIAVSGPIAPPSTDSLHPVR